MSKWGIPLHLYAHSKWKISVRHNMENDRVDEGDIPEEEFHKEILEIQVFKKT